MAQSSGELPFTEAAASGEVALDSSRSTCVNKANRPALISGHASGPPGRPGSRHSWRIYPPAEDGDTLEKDTAMVNCRHAHDAVLRGWHDNVSL